MSNEDGKDISITDGMWIIALGACGMVGLLSYFSALLLPLAILVSNCRADTWQLPTLAPICVLALIANLYAIHCLANAMTNPIYFLALGGVMGVLGRSDIGVRLGLEGQTALVDEDDETRLGQSAPNRAARSSRTIPGKNRRSGSTQGRALMERGMVREAEEAWRSAIQIWERLAADYPGEPEYRKCWLDGLNDSAWSLVLIPNLSSSDASRAIQLAERAVRWIQGGRLLEYPGDRLLPRQRLEGGDPFAGTIDRIEWIWHQLRLLLPVDGLVASGRQGAGQAMVRPGHAMDGEAQSGPRGSPPLPGRSEGLDQRRAANRMTRDRLGSTRPLRPRRSRVHRAVLVRRSPLGTRGVSAVGIATGIGPRREAAAESTSGRRRPHPPRPADR